MPTNLSNLKSKLDVDKLIPVPVDLSKLNDAVLRNFVIFAELCNFCATL